MRLAELNALPAADARARLFACCGSEPWADAMVAARPFASFAKLAALADQEWSRLTQNEWRDAFKHHPRIGDLATLRSKWTAQEQGGVAGASDDVLAGLVAGNEEYEKRFGHVFLICATGKSAAEMLAALRARIRNEHGVEVCLAAAEQAKITLIRLKKLLDDDEVKS